MIAALYGTAGALQEGALAAISFGVLLFAMWTMRNPAAFWKAFNPFLRADGRFAFRFGFVIGLLWTVGAICGCIIGCGSAWRAGLQHHWL